MPSSQKEQNCGLAISRRTESYHPALIKKLQDRFPDNLIRFNYSTHGNAMPIYLVGKAQRVLMIQFFNGENYEQAFGELAFAGNAFTTNYDKAGSNTDDLSLFYPFGDLRDHDKTRKLIDNDPNRTAIVKAQGITDEAWARTMRHVAGASRVYFVEAHNPYRSSRHFENCGLSFIDLTTNDLFAQFLRDNNLLDNNRETVVVSTDIGDLLESDDLANKLNFPLVINFKTRDGDRVNQRSIPNEQKSLQGVRALVKDDCISGGSTIEETVKHLIDQEVAEIIIFATHAILVGDYFKKIQGVLNLRQPSVRLLVTDSLPFDRIDGTTKALPYSQLNPSKQVEVLEVTDWISDRVGDILNAPNEDEALKILKPHILKIKNPYDVLMNKFNLKIKPPEDLGIYHEGGRIEYFKK